MLLSREFGSLHEPLTGHRLGPAQILQLCADRARLYADLGLEPGDRVFLHYGNVPEFFIDLLAIWHLGACAVPVDSRFTPFEVENAVQVARPRFSVWETEPEASIGAVLARQGVRLLGSADRAANGDGLPPARLQLDADALILFTSGTTGQPKGVVHTHRSLRARWMSLRDCLGTDTFERSLCLLPTHFGHGLICNCLFPWLAGKDLYLMPAFRPDVLTQLAATLDRESITFMSSVPALWRLVLRTAKPPAARTLQRVFCGSAPLSAALWQSIAEWTGAGEVGNAYGITETGSWLAGSAGLGLAPADGLVGRGWGSEVRVLRTADADVPPGVAEVCRSGEAGYVWVNTPALMRGYLGRDDLTRQVVSHGWFVTGDIGMLDDGGVLVLRGRERDEINKGGMKVYPADIDAVIERFPGTRDVCAFACPDPLLGENVGVAVVLEDGSDPALLALHDWAAQHLAAHQMPQRWYVVHDIPRTSRGKVNRQTVAERCESVQVVPMTRLLRARGGPA
jgi:acyl-CoA synthetase (AMP-forming)/AMP-acid ligase II